MDDAHITLAHGNGGRFMRALIDDIFVRHLANPSLDTRLDAVPTPLEEAGIPVMTTDGFTVQPLEFPGGDIGSLAVHGTVNDLAVSGATPHYLTLNCFIEEGIETALLDRVVGSLAAAAQEAGVRVAAGDTKVVPRGLGGGIYLATTGLGVRPPSVTLAPESMRPGDRILVSGPVGDHGTAVMLAREEFGLRGDVRSDAASVWPLTRILREIPGVRFMRDPTRGGLATAALDAARLAGCTARLSEDAIPVRDPVRSVCQILGYDPLYLACEGRILVVVSPQSADKVLESLHALEGGAGAAMVGELVEGRPELVLQTLLGGERLLDELEDDPLPRIC